MKVGFMGLGKLGLPVALAVEKYGEHEVYGYDINPEVIDLVNNWGDMPYHEVIAPTLLKTNSIVTTGPAELVATCDLIFVPIQTPHEPRFEGTTRLPDERKDFDYTYLLAGIETLAYEAVAQQREVVVVVISTCLPGTFETKIQPLIEGNKYIHYVYNPFFIAMGTVIPDFMNPEFVLVGTDGDRDAAALLTHFYGTLHDKPIFITDVTTAEGIKVFYNTFITMKTVLGNIYGEMATQLGMNVDDIWEALSMATDRIISPAYLKSGVGDGGGCHPRDNIALSWLANEVNLSHNIFEDLMKAREDHMEWFAQWIATLSEMQPDLPVVILGRSFKPETNIETGSPSVLLSNLLLEKKVGHRHVEDLDELYPAIYFIGTKHERYASLVFPEGSMVIDPFRYIPRRNAPHVYRVGDPIASRPIP